MEIKGFHDILNLWKMKLPGSVVPLGGKLGNRLQALIDLLEQYKEAGYERSQIICNKNKIIDKCYNVNSPKKSKWRKYVADDLDDAISAVMPDLAAGPKTLDTTPEPEYIPEPEVNAVEERKVDLPAQPALPKKPIPPPRSEKDIPPRSHIIYDEDMEYILGFKK